MIVRHVPHLAVLLVVAAVATAAAQSLPAPATDALSPGESLVRQARALSNERRYRESSEAWRRVAAAEPLLLEFAHQQSIRALFFAGDVPDALAAISGTAGPLPADLLLQAGHAARGAGMLDRALSLYRQARAAAGRTSVADDAALGIAATFEQDKKPGDALEAYRELQLTFRQARAYDEATTGAKRLAAQTANAPPLSEDDYESIADRLAGVAAFGRAIDVLTEWRSAFPASLHLREIDASLVQDLYSLRANDQARAQAEQFLKTYPEGPDARAAAITLFRLEVREGKTAEVERRGRDLLDLDRGLTLGERQGVARLLAEYLVSVGEPGKALAFYDQLYQLVRTRGERIDVRWRTAIAALRSGNRGRAIRDLQETLRLQPDPETERAAMFWLGYAQDVAGQKAAARTVWTGLIAKAPFSYYGARAASRLGVDDTGPPLTFPAQELREEVLAHRDYKAAALLSRAGLADEAAVFARRLQSAFRRDPAVALLAARASKTVGDYSSTSTLMTSFFGDYLQRPATGLPNDFWELAYPLAFWPEISAGAARHDVDPLLMLGLARQESHFDPAARSPVGAVGLFQLMPYTAAELDPAFASAANLARLVEPAVSAELGAAHLAQHLARFGGALAPTIASYNADRERVQVWWDEAKELPEELFIDSIPYRETRAYVRQVLANYAMYRRAFEKRPAVQSTSPQK